MIRHDETGAIIIVPITFLATCKDCEANVGMTGEWCMLLHVRGSSFEWHKPLSGMQTKPDDTWTVPLCSACHRKQLENPHDQKAKSELGRMRLLGRLGEKRISDGNTLWCYCAPLFRRRASANHTIRWVGGAQGHCFWRGKFFVRHFRLTGQDVTISRE